MHVPSVNEVFTLVFTCIARMRYARVDCQGRNMSRQLLAVWSILSRKTLMAKLTLGAHAHESYCSQFVYVLCVCACYHSSTGVRHVWEKLKLPARSSLNYKGFQQADFAKKLLSRVVACFSFSHGQVGHLQFIEVATWEVCLTTFS